MNRIKTLTEYILNNDLVKASECFDAILRQKIHDKLYEGDTKQINKQHRKEIEKTLGTRLDNHLNYSSDDLSSGRTALRILPKELLKKLLDNKKYKTLSVQEQSFYDFSSQKRIRDISNPIKSLQKNITNRMSFDRKIKNIAKNSFGKIKGPK